MLSFKDIKNFKGILNKKPKSTAQKIAIGAAGILFGMVLILIPGWILIVKLEFFQVPELMLHFFKTYIVLIAFLVMGFVVVVKSIIFLLKK